MGAELKRKPRWLSQPEQRDWRAFISLTRLLPVAFEQDLQRTHALSMADYEILVRLSESPNRSMRMSELADFTLASRSRLTHQIDRMERAGLVSRRACESDRRGSWADMTDQGWQALVAAAPDHVESVRVHLMDVLTPAEFEALGEISRKILQSLAPELQAKAIVPPPQVGQ